MAVLRVDTLKKSDQGDEHILRVTNPRGTTEYTVKIQHITSEITTIMSQFYHSLSLDVLQRSSVEVRLPES